MNVEDMKVSARLVVILVVFLGSILGCNRKPLHEGGLLNPVLPGDSPNPTIVQVGDSFYASTTSNEWSPLFPIFKSNDLQHWELVSYVFPGGAPDWTDQNFWSPELSYDEVQGKMYVFYAARHNRTERSCVAVAVADSPEGPYIDKGPLKIHKSGSIDPFEIRDEEYTPFLVWKEEYNPGKPSIIWIQQLNENRTGFVGEKHELIRNDCEWEEHTVEGPSIFKRDNYYYLLYSAGNCCDNNCNYKIGVARSTSLIGNWEKYEANPVITDNSEWKCPGSGTVIAADEDYYLLYHAYRKEGGFFVGREGVLQKIEWTDSGWPVFSMNISANCPKENLNFSDDFSGALNTHWQWRATQQLTFATGENGLMLEASTENDQLGSLIVQPIRSTNFKLEAVVDISNSGLEAEGGIALIGASNNGYGASIAGIGISVGHNLVKVWQTSDEMSSLLEAIEIEDDVVELRMELEAGHILHFSFLSNGEWRTIASSIDASVFTPWGMGFRFGVVANGKEDSFVNIKRIDLSNF